MLSNQKITYLVLQSVCELVKKVMLNGILYICFLCVLIWPPALKAEALVAEEFRVRCAMRLVILANVIEVMSKTHPIKIEIVDDMYGNADRIFSSVDRKASQSDRAQIATIYQLEMEAALGVFEEGEDELAALKTLERRTNTCLRLISE